MKFEKGGALRTFLGDVEVGYYFENSYSFTAGHAARDDTYLLVFREANLFSASMC